MLTLLPIILSAALIDSINPCALSVLLLTIAFLFSLGRSRGNIIFFGASYILGIFVVYVLIGLGILKALSVFNIPHFMAKVGALILITFGALTVMNKLFPKFPIKLKIPQTSHAKIAILLEKGSAPALFLMGGFVGLFEFPCTGGPYLMVLGLLHDQSTFVSGFGYLIFYNLIFILPLVAILLLASDNLILKKVQYLKRVNVGVAKLFSGCAMIALGLIIFFVN